jgi:hypothetical protein
LFIDDQLRTIAKHRFAFGRASRDHRAADDLERTSELSIVGQSTRRRDARICERAPLSARRRHED